MLPHYAILFITQRRDVVEREDAGRHLYIIDERLWDMTYLTDSLRCKMTATCVFIVPTPHPQARAHPHSQCHHISMLLLHYPSGEVSVMLSIVSSDCICAF